jgi:hypothetical protein
MRLMARNWAEFQHYKDRSPPWIRLHRKLLNNKDFQRLPDASRALAPMLWLLASESLDGSINADADEISFQVRQPEEWVQRALKPLIEKGFFAWEEAGASTALAECPQPAVPEAEAETEERQRESPAAATPSPPAPKQKRKSPTTALPEGFGISERVRTWAAAKGHANLAQHLECFLGKVRAKDYRYVDWDEAFMGAIRDDWAKLRDRRSGQPAEPANAVGNAAATRLMLAAQQLTPEQIEANKAAARALRERKQAA